MANLRDLFYPFEGGFWDLGCHGYSNIQDLMYGQYFYFIMISIGTAMLSKITLLDVCRKQPARAVILYKTSNPQSHGALLLPASSSLCASYFICSSLRHLP